MITSIAIEGFKSLRRVRLELGRFNLFIGTNASGKSNFLDALRVLQGVGYGFTVDEILNGKPRSAGSEAWQAIRGGSVRAAYIREEANGEAESDRIGFSVELRIEEFPEPIQYSLALSPSRGCMLEERLIEGRNPVFDSSPVANDPGKPTFDVRYYTGSKGRAPHLSFEKSRPVLHQLTGHEGHKGRHKEVLAACARALKNMQRLDPSPVLLRNYSTPQFVDRMGERGENFAALINAILRDDQAKPAYLSWLRQLTPGAVEDVKIYRGALGEPMFALIEDGEPFHAPILSDGTLRFAAIAAAFFQPDLPDVLTIEEVENGIHPTRLRLLVDLLRSQAQLSRPQVVATTHSPIVLAWLKESDYSWAFFCKREEQSRETTICPLAQVPNFVNLTRKQPIHDLFSEGWLEGAL